ncbi:uncharacterized protein [Palaemon carinicauda]|uniref:uncharacterized protein n=1 Tax=Palaemon carinicauda TaxID=392227 RepID=UPI0035B66EDF
MLLAIAYHYAVIHLRLLLTIAHQCVDIPHRAIAKLSDCTHQLIIDRLWIYIASDLPHLRGSTIPRRRANACRSQGFERETAPLAPKRKAPPAHPAVVPDVPDKAPSLPPKEVRDTREARDTREVRDARPRAVPVPAPTRPRVATTQLVAPEVAKPAHGRSLPPLEPRVSTTVTIAADAPKSRPVPATRPVPVFKTAVVAQLTPERPHAALTTRPPKQRTPVRPVPDARYALPRSPAQLALTQVSKPVQLGRHQASRSQVARNPAPAVSRPRPVLPDMRSGAPVIARPPGPHQVAARPRVRPPPVPAPDRRTPTPLPTRARGHVPAQAAVRPRGHAPALSPARHRS